MTPTLTRRALLRLTAATTLLSAALPALADGDAPSAEMPFEKRLVEVNGSKMAYVDEGEGPVVLFLHGNPTSSYLWRNIIPFVTEDHRAIAVDLIGMGDSDKPDIGYTFADHAAYLDGFIAALDLQDITLVIHDWGSVLGMRYARLNEGNVKAIAFMEAGIPPALPAPSLEAMGPQNAELFAMLRSPAGDEAVLQNNFFVEEVLGKFGVATPLSDEVLAQYRKPFPTPESRKPTLVWPRQIPIAGEPADTGAVITANGEWLYSTDMPKLMLHVAPGALMPPPVVEYVKANASNLEDVFLGPGVHFVQEDHPTAIGRALRDWIDRLPA
ncbi:haloalkane dehalogenase [Litoreibacter ponti]|uniref:Haloalkane dehalogenase n=1 Tax=Litoreibacter ponti TaxID=1510457 RepID=A0A2T6BJX2_9RHOB|nr:haloalkane dehalogenase [Litoreibacter ponti]PTX56355.1 haloalkane dehalogenase [Litoreibacter ponti]